MRRRSAGPGEIEFYEGLVRATASRCACRVDESFEDVASVLRIKVWRALVSFDPSRSTMTVQAYVFSCVKNQEKDLLKRKRRREVYLADETPVGGSVDHDSVYEEVERELPVIPSTLTAVERLVVIRLYMDVSQREIATELGVSRSEMERLVRSIRLKMADWKPSAQPALQAA